MSVQLQLRDGESIVGGAQEIVDLQVERQEAFKRMDALDNEQIIGEISGQFAKNYIYDIPYRGGNTFKCDVADCELKKDKINHTHAIGLAYTGVKEARRLYGHIELKIVQKPKIIEIEGRKFFETKVSAKDVMTGNLQEMLYIEPLEKKRRDGSFYLNDFAYQICLSKVCRNAIATLLPQPVMNAWIQDKKLGAEGLDPKKMESYKSRWVRLESKTENPTKEDKTQTKKGPPQPTKKSPPPKTEPPKTEPPKTELPQEPHEPLEQEQPKETPEERAEVDMECINKARQEMRVYLREKLINSVQDENKNPNIPAIQKMIQVSSGKAKLQDMNNLELAKLLNSLLLFLKRQKTPYEEAFLGSYLLDE